MKPMFESYESILVSIGAGLVILAVGLLIPKAKKLAVGILALGIALLTYVIWPRSSLIEVPDLSDLSRDEASSKLQSVRLVGSPNPQVDQNTDPEYVILNSQRPFPGTKVIEGSVVSYSVSVFSGSVQSKRIPPENLNERGVNIFLPKDESEVAVTRRADNTYSFEVEGVINGFSPNNSELLLWLQPVQPPSDQPGWYLQRLPANGIRSISGNKWRGICQIGNQQYPSHDGDIVEIVASVVSAEDASKLNSKRGPMISVSIPGVASEVIRLKVKTQ